jgi:tetratricopeptide (TPR) repeat protein
MAQILKLPVQASKLGYRRVRKRAKPAENPDQLDLFPQGNAQILTFAPSELSPFEQALILDERGDLHAAELYTKAIDQQDCVADSFCNLGIIESKRGDTIKAFDCFTKCLKHNPRHSEAHYNLANLYFDQNDFRLAQLHFEMAAEIDPSFANAYFNLALVQAINNDIARALVTLGKYQQLVPEADGKVAAELLEDLKKSLTAAKHSRFSSP